MPTARHSAPTRSLPKVLVLVLGCVLGASTLGAFAATGSSVARALSLAAAFIVFGGNLVVALVDHPGERVHVDRFAPYWSAATAALAFGFFLGAFASDVWP